MSEFAAYIESSEKEHVLYVLSNVHKCNFVRLYVHVTLYIKWTSEPECKTRVSMMNVPNKNMSPSDQYTDH